MKGVLHRHSTLFAVLTSTILGLAVTGLTHWPWPFALLVAVVGMCVLPRAFYGRAESRALDDAPVAPGSFGIHSRDMAGLGTNAYILEQAYEETQMAGYDSDGKPIDPNDFKRLAESEETP